MAPTQLPSAAGRPATSPYTSYSPYSQFHLPSSSSSEDGGNRNGSDDDDDDFDLPFPTALARKDFLTPTFDPTAYLSSLFPSDVDVIDTNDSAIGGGGGGTTATVVAQRHQTLEDLRAELRERSSAIGGELLELVNANYTKFLGLGDELRGGDERAEDVRVALFGFRRAVEDVQGRVRERQAAVAQACDELKEVRAGVHAGRRLLELEAHAAALEERLAVGAGDKKELETSEWDNLDESEDDEDDGGGDDDAHNGGEPAYVGSSPAKLAALARDLVLAHRLADAAGHQSPFVKKVDERLATCRGTLLLDLNTAVKEVRRLGVGKGQAGGQSRLLKLLAIYRVLDSEDEIVRILKEKP